MRGRLITYEELDIREDGIIYYEGKPKNCHRHCDGYLSTKFSGKSHLVHRLVADKYIPNPENKRTINHINGIKTDNRVSNLEWNTNGENMKHAYNTGLINQKHRRKLTIDEVREIRSKYVPRKYTMKRLSDEYGMAECNIHNIIRNKTYVEV